MLNGTDSTIQTSDGFRAKMRALTDKDTLGARGFTRARDFPRASLSVRAQVHMV